MILVSWYFNAMTILSLLIYYINKKIGNYSISFVFFKYLILNLIRKLIINN